MDLDDAMSDLEEIEGRGSVRADASVEEPIETMMGGEKELVGTVEKYFSRIDVAAVKLKGHLKVGDAIEIRDGDGEIREIVTSMQIDRKDVTEAFGGDDVGIKLTNPVPEGSRVYRLPRQQG